jgi:hypothetical protein
MTQATTPAPRPKPKHPIPYISGPGEIPNDVYHEGPEYIDFTSSTSLKHYQISPKYANWAKYNQENTETAAKRFGSIYHDYLASLVNCGSLEQFNKTWGVFEPPINEKTGAPYGSDTKKSKDALEQQRADLGVNDLCSKEEIDHIKAMVKELREGSRHLSHIVNRFIKNGKAEQSHFCHYQGQGFKYRTDLKTNKIILDWKTCEQPYPKVDEFSRQIINFGYHISAAMYQFFDAQVTGKWRKFYWIAQEKQPPYDFTILDSSEWTWKIHPGGEIQPGPGAMEFIKLLEQHIICTENQDWPGYSIFIQPDWKNYRIGLPAVPGYYKQKDFNFYND